jgi:hypothetical protein
MRICLQVTGHNLQHLVKFPLRTYILFFHFVFEAPF